MWIFRCEVGIAVELLERKKVDQSTTFLIAFCREIATLSKDKF